MKRSIRRHQQRVAKLRRVRILRAHGAFRGYCGFGYVFPQWSGPDKPWATIGRQVMNDPGWWRHERSVVPARIATHRLEHLVNSGRDPDSLNWPNFRRPYAYYW